MKILFVCKGNVSRSQIAEALYNHITSSNDASSAGTHVDNPGMTLGERQKIYGSNTLEVMRELGFNLSSQRQTQLTKAMLNDYDKIVSMCDESIAPSWLKDSPNYTYWEIKDPVGAELPFFRQTVENIRQKINQMTI